MAYEIRHVLKDMLARSKDPDFQWEGWIDFQQDLQEGPKGLMPGPDYHVQLHMTATIPIRTGPDRREIKAQGYGGYSSSGPLR